MKALLGWAWAWMSLWQGALLGASGPPALFPLSSGYSTQHVVEGLEPRTVYRFRLRVTSPSGDCEYSPVVSVSTTSE